MYVHPVPLIENTPPWTTATGSTASVAIGQIVAMNVVTSISRRKYLVDATYATSSSIASTPKTLPSSEASPPGDALRSTSATPANASNANTSARGEMYSRKSQAPTGTIRNGAHDPIRAAFATLLCVAPAKNTARFSPKKTPGTHTARTSRIVTRRPVVHRTTFHARLTRASRQKATRTPAVSARFTSVELSENATTSPTTASTPNVLALSARIHAGARAACEAALIGPHYGAPRSSTIRRRRRRRRSRPPRTSQK